MRRDAQRAPTRRHAASCAQPAAWRTCSRRRHVFRVEQRRERCWHCPVLLPGALAPAVLRRDGNGRNLPLQPTAWRPRQPAGGRASWRSGRRGLTGREGHQRSGGDADARRTLHAHSGGRSVGRQVLARRSRRAERGVSPRQPPANEANTRRERRKVAPTLQRACPFWAHRNSLLAAHGRMRAVARRMRAHISRAMRAPKTTLHGLRATGATRARRCRIVCTCVSPGAQAQLGSLSHSSGGVRAWLLTSAGIGGAPGE